MNARAPSTIWVDLANSPHPVLFEPLVEQLEGRGHRVVLTARDHAQTIELARQRWPAVSVIGGQSPAGRPAKARMTVGRARALAHFARREGVDIAVSHNSYAAAVAARMAGIPCLTAMDYEHQPANHIAFRAADRVLVPRDFPARALREQGGSRAKTWRYDGFKEEVYLAGFVPDPRVLRDLGLDAGEAFFVARPSPQGASYHQFDNPLFDRALKRALARADARVVLLPRRPQDLVPFADVPEARKIVPRSAVDTRSLLFYARAMLGAGGTMNREAALLGTPVVSLYAGRMAALDRRLIAEGRLHPLRDDLKGFDETLTGFIAGGDVPSVVGSDPRVRDRFLEAILTPFGSSAPQRQST